MKPYIPILCCLKHKDSCGARMAATVSYTISKQLLACCLHNIGLHTGLHSTEYTELGLVIYGMFATTTTSGKPIGLGS